ncbi:MAG: ATP-binding cassette domain-containing protein [Spirochaetota bacterium]
MSGNNVILKIEGLNYSTGEKQILKDLCLTVKRNTIHSILGANGTGKTTLGFVLMGLSGYKPSSGKIIFDGRNIIDFTITKRSRTGLTLAWQHSTPFEGISVSDYLSIAARNTNFDYRYALTRLGLKPSAYLQRSYDATLSGGERKRIELAAIMTMKPKLAILDEPDSGIDMLSLENISDVIKEINQNGSTVLLITHSWKMAHKADISSHLCDGTILMTGDPEEVAKFYISKCQSCDHINYPQMEELPDVQG